MGTRPIRVALVHDWLTGMRGGEAVLEAMIEVFESPRLFTLLRAPGSISSTIANVPTTTSFLQNIPGIEKNYRSFLPIMPLAIEALDLSEFDLVLSSSHCVAKGVKKSRHALHVSYIHAPMRYIWDRFEDYFGKNQASLPVRMAAKLVQSRLQSWDRKSSQENRIDHLIANSHFIADRIQEFYHRQAHVVFPFAELSRFGAPRVPGKDYLMVGAFAPYKKVDLAIEVFNQLELPLVIVGSGQDERKLRKLAGPTIRFLGALPNSEVNQLFSHARAFVFPALEDFGISLVESIGSGCPVIAYQKGGALDILTKETGIFFSDQTQEALKSAILEFESAPGKFTETHCRAQAQKFSRENFKNALKTELRLAWKTAQKDPELLEAVFKPSSS